MHSNRERGGERERERERERETLGTQTIPSATSSTIPSDSPGFQKVQTPGWVAESKATGEKTVRKFNSTTKQTELAGEVLYNSFDSSIELTDDIQNLKNGEFEFTNQENYISVKGKLKQNQSLWKNTIKGNGTVLNVMQEGYRSPFWRLQIQLESVIISLQ